MDFRKLSFTLMTLSFIFIMAGAVSTFVMGLQNDRNEFYKRINDIDNSFESFSTNVSAFGNIRDDLYSAVISNTHYENMFQDDVHVKNKLSNYEHLVDELTRNVNYLTTLCNDNDYFRDGVSDKCAKYKSIYEQVVNFFVSDINVYNNNILKYNEYQKALKKSYFIDFYQTDKDYVDYNNDSVYEGKG